jgi:hexosaminidase
MDSASLQFLPIPRQITFTGGVLSLPHTGYILAAPALLFEAQRLKAALQEAGRHWRVAVTADAALAIRLRESQPTHPQSYRLTIRNDDPPGIDIEGSHAGIFYGVCTLAQLLRQTDGTLPALVIEDAPDFAARGVLLDISRDKVPTLQTVLELVDLLAGFKVNQLQLYMEHTFAYSQHPAVWEHASPFTHEEILVLDAYCRQRHVALVPNQNSLGHMERWLKLPRYNALAESPEGFEPAWGGEWRSASTLNPLDPGSLALVESLYDELLPHFSSRLFNVGADEPWELGKGKSKEAVAQRGGRVYLDYLRQLHEAVTKRGRQMQFWGDIIIHYPDLIPELPRDMIAMEWGYEADHAFPKHNALYAEAGVPFYVCPGTSSWNSLVGRVDNARENIRLAAEDGLQKGAIGLLNTDWGGNGHWQPLPASYPAFAYGAAVAWCYRTNRDIDLGEVLDRFVFQDVARAMGKLAMDLGNVYQMVGAGQFNGQALAYALQRSEAQLLQAKRSLRPNDQMPDITPATLRQVIARIDALIAGLQGHQMQRADGGLIVDEYVQAARLLEHGAKWLLLVQGESDYVLEQLQQELAGLVAQQKVNWLARNRPGGLEDSLRRLEVLQREYERLSQLC